MFQINPIAVLKDLKNSSWSLIIFALLIIIPYLLYKPILNYYLLRASKKSELDTVKSIEQDSSNQSEALNDWEKTQIEVEKERNK